MSLVTGTSPASGNIGVNDSPLGIVYNVPNRIIPNAQAGIGDIVFESASSAGTYIVMAGETYTATPSGYSLVGVIYGFENGQAMIMAASTASKHWIAHSATESDLKYDASYSAQTTLPSTYALTGMVDTAGRARNGTKGRYMVLNLTRVIAWLASNGQSTAAEPDAGAYTAWPTETAFSANAGLVAKYGTFRNYLSQVRPIGYGGGGVFGADWHIGRLNTKAMAAYSASSLHSITVTMNGSNYTGVWYPAANYAWNYSAGNAQFWLPDTVELRKMMRDETVVRVNKALAKCGTQISVSSNYWSSVRFSRLGAWYYNNAGFSNANNFGSAYIVRPVTLLKI